MQGVSSPSLTHNKPTITIIKECKIIIDQPKWCKSKFWIANRLCQKPDEGNVIKI